MTVVLLGQVSDDSIAPNLYVIVAHGVRHRPDLAAAMNASVVLRFHDGYAPVRIDFRGDEVEVGDDLGGPDRPYDLEVSGRMGDVTALIDDVAVKAPKPGPRAERAARSGQTRARAAEYARAGEQGRTARPDRVRTARDAQRALAAAARRAG